MLMLVTLRPAREVRRTIMTHEIRQCISREATLEKKVRHRAFHEEIQQALPELKQWARETTARQQEREEIYQQRNRDTRSDWSHAWF